MRRLIDADKFLDFIKSELKQDRTDEKHLENIICVLENLPTAFDVDKVEKELEEKVENSNLNIQIICFSQALDIFKGGKNE